MRAAILWLMLSHTSTPVSSLVSSAFLERHGFGISENSHGSYLLCMDKTRVRHSSNKGDRAKLVKKRAYVIDDALYHRKNRRKKNIYVRDRFCQVIHNRKWPPVGKATNKPCDCRKA